MNTLLPKLPAFRSRLAGRIWQILGPAQRKSAVLVFLGMLVGTIAEAVSVGVVVPVMMVFAGATSAEALPMVPEAVWQSSDSRNEWLVMLGFVALLAIFLLKALLLVATAWQQSQFLAAIRENVATRLAEIYLHQPWTFHLQRNSSQLIRNCTTEVIMFMAGCSGMLTIFAEGCVIIGIALLLLAMEPIATLLVIIFLAAATWALHVLLGSRLRRWGTERQTAEELRVKWLQQGLGGVREVKVYSKEAEFLKHFATAEKIAARAIRMSDFAIRVPRVLYELLAVAGISVVGLSLYLTGVSASAIFPRLGLFAVAAFRLLPSINRIASALTSAHFMEPAIDVLGQELALEIPPPVSESNEKLSFNHELRADHLSFGYPGGDGLAIHDICFTISAGTSAGIVGESGAGKSTLVDLLLGLLTPDQGQITVDGKAISERLRQWQNTIGYVPQNIFLLDDTIRANVAFGVPSDQVDHNAVDAALAAAQLTRFVESLPTGADAVIGERGVRLSGGQRQRIGIARALYWDPPILFLDEATSALDTATEQQVMDGVEALHGKKTLIIIAHRMSTVQHCDVLFTLSRGRLITAGNVPATGDAG